MSAPTSLFGSRPTKALVIATMLLALALAACAPSIVDAGDKPTQDPANPPDQSLGHGGLDIAEIEVFLMESFPIQVGVFVRGHLRDGCTEIDATSQTFNPATSTFEVEITTVRDADALCTLALVPFEERVVLDVFGLEAGTYTVNVNGVIDTFTLDADNAPPANGEGDGVEGTGTPSDQAMTYGTADVEEIDIRIMESDPVQVAVVARGYLGDGCTEIDGIRQRFDAAAGTFHVEITTARPTEAICILILQGFEERIILDVEGLVAGTYTVNVNGVTDTFTLDR